MRRFILVVFVFAAIVLGLIIFHHSDTTETIGSSGTDTIAFGDSLVFGVGATKNHDLVSLLSAKTGVPIINLGHSGDTTAQGVARLSELDRYNPKLVIILLGGNDALQSVPIETTFQNLEIIIKNIQQKHAQVLLLGIRGGVIADPYKARFLQLSQKYNTMYVPDVLSGLFGDQKYMSDEVHPNDQGYAKIAERVYPVLKQMLR